jgi:DNA-binding PucR family transcriptional regulator
VPSRIVRHYDEAVANYQDGRWQSATQIAGVVLEGVVKDLLEQAGATSSGRLADDLKSIAGKVELTRPLTDAADALRLVRNLASHYDQRGEVTEDLASEMLDLLDTVLQYLLLVPAQASRLKDRLRQDGLADGIGAAVSSD